MKPTLDCKELEKGDIVEDRDGVKIEFRGAMWFRLYKPDGTYVAQAGAEKAAALAEEMRLELNPDYAAPDEAKAEPAPKEKPTATEPRAFDVSGLTGQIWVDEVETLLGIMEEEYPGRIARLQGLTSVQNRQHLVQVTDGMAAPVIFCERADGSGDYIAGGLDNLAAASLAGMGSMVCVKCEADEVTLIEQIMFRRHEPAGDELTEDEEALIWAAFID